MQTGRPPELSYLSHQVTEFFVHYGMEGLTLARLCGRGEDDAAYQEQIMQLAREGKSFLERELVAWLRLEKRYIHQLCQQLVGRNG
jgi:uncharacterized protein YgfB (UPF0149 family)